MRPNERPSELTRNSRCQNTGRAKDPPPLGGVRPTAAWQRSIARSKKIATAAWWLQPQSEQQPRWSFASWPCYFLAEIALGASQHLLNSLAGLPLLICATQIERTSLRRYFSLGKSVTIVAKHQSKTAMPNLHQLHGWGRSVSQIVELPYVEHLSKNRYSIVHGPRHSRRFICARRRWRCPRWSLGYNGTLNRSSTKRWSNWRGANAVDRPERDPKC